MLTKEALNYRYAGLEHLTGRKGPYKRSLRRHVDFEPRSVLDVGCALGDGLLVAQRMWPNATLGGIDLSEVATQKAQARLGGGTFWSFDITGAKKSIPNFDLVLCVHTLEHLSYRADVVTKTMVWLQSIAARMLIIVVPYRFTIPEPDHRMVFGVKSFDGLHPTLVEHMGHDHIVAVWRKPDASA